MKKHLIAIVVGLFISLMTFLAQGLFLGPDTQQSYRILSDGFFLSGVLLAGTGLLSWIAGKGQFTGIRYLGHWLGTTLGWGYPKKRPMGYYEYRQQQSQRSIGSGFLLLPGLGFLALAVVFLLLFNQQPAQAQGQSQQNEQTKVTSTTIATEDNMDKHPIFTITLQDGNVIKGELYPATAPQSVGNFIALANQHFYDGLIFHRVIPGFMVQGGCPTGTGMGGPGYSIKGEFSKNGVRNDIAHTRGVLSMARSARNDSAGSQFFIMVADSPHLDGSYAAFGRVTEGMEALDQVVATRRDAQDKPLTPQVIKSIEVETFGVEYPFDRL